MSVVRIETYVANILSKIITSKFKYDTNGTKVQKIVETDNDADGTIDSSTTTTYLNDNNNFTGYAKIIEEITRETATQNITDQKVYTIGNSIIAQTQLATGAAEEGNPLLLITDGLGSTRYLVDALGNVINSNGAAQVFQYDAFGNAKGFEPKDALTSFLKSGEFFDSNIGKQYLINRWYDPRIGTFNRSDPFAGFLRDPQSLNKYLYTHGDPINNIDPNGLFSLSGMLSTMGSSTALRSMVTSAVTSSAGRAIMKIGLEIAVARATIMVEALNQKVVPIPRQKIRKDYQYALLAEAGYEKANLANVNANGWIKLKKITFDSSGFNAVLFQRNGEKVLSFAGTNPLDPQDWINNVQQGLFGDAPQYRQAIETVRKFEKKFGKIDRFVGHSLGGGLASAAAIVFNRRPATTFNAAGLNVDFVAKYGKNLAGADQFIDAYRVQGEFLSTVQDASFWWMITP